MPPRATTCAAVIVVLVSLSEATLSHVAAPSGRDKSMGHSPKRRNTVALLMVAPGACALRIFRTVCAQVNVATSSPLIFFILE
jgi:hypothetical protein